MAQKMSIKAQIKLVIEKHLYSKPARNYNNQLSELIIKDAVARRDGARCFTHRGKNYVIPGELPNVRIFPRLSKENREAMDTFLAHWEPIFGDEKAKIGAYIAHVLNSSDDPNVYLRSFPSVLRTPLKSLYQIYEISPDDLPFEEAEPTNPVWKEAYGLLCIRLNSNLLLE